MTMLTMSKKCPKKMPRLISRLLPIWKREAVSEISRESLGNLKMAQPEQKNFTIKRDDIQLIMQELEVPRIVAEAKLIQYEGDLRAAILDLIDCNSLLK
ncbi:unnamed protein product [Meloidogyne enterolobii]|uniref:Uncharacterized protein n=1 Tax=Meloidogyne enterolobii TaxID=390850 RepID=A0ACB0Z6A3_MELEN